MKLVPEFPCVHLDGEPMSGCEHHKQTNDGIEIAVIKGLGNTIIQAGIPEPIVRAGDSVITNWGCERNKKLKFRDAVIYKIIVALVRHPQRMFYRPEIFYYGRNKKYDGMVLDNFNYNGKSWLAPKGNKLPTTFRLEWLSDSGDIEHVQGSGVHLIYNKYQ